MEQVNSPNSKCEKITPKVTQSSNELQMNVNMVTDI